MKRILFLVLTGLLGSLVSSAQVASRSNYGVIRLGNNMIDSSGYVRILFPQLVPSSTAVRAMLSGASGVNYSQAEGIFTISNTYVNTLIDNRLKSFDGYDPAVSKVLSTTGSGFQWIVASVSSSTSTGGSSTPVSPRDTVLLYADSTQSRIVTSSMTSVTLTTAAQIRTFLTTTQTNKDAIVANGNYNDGARFDQTSNWTNVRFRAQTIGGVTLGRDNDSQVLFFTNTHTINRVCIQGFKLVSAYNNTGSATYPILATNELVGGDGLEIADCEITSNSLGVYNGFGMAQYSMGSNSGATIKNIWLHRNYIHHMGRGNEILSQGYDYPRIIGVVISNNRFEYMGINDQYGFGMSKSGLIKGILEINNRFVQNRRICSEFVNTQYAISMNNSFSVTGANVVEGYGISDDGVNSTKYLYFENNTMTVTGRPFYVYGAKGVVFQNGGTYNGNHGVDMTGSNNTFKNITVNIWDKQGPGYAWQIDVAASGNTLDGVNLSSSNTVANGGSYAKEVLLLKGSNNTIINSTFTQGKQTDNSYYGFILANSGTNNTLTNNTLQNGN